MKIRFTQALLLTASALLTGSLHAETLYWGNGTGNSTWNTAANWSTDPDNPTPNPGSAPSGTNDVVFNISSLTTNQSIALGGARAVNSLTFNSTGTTELTQASAARLTIGSGGLVVNSGAGAVTLSAGNNNLEVGLAGSQTWANNSSSLLNLSSTATTGVSADAADVNTLIINSSGSGGITIRGGLRNGTGTLALVVNTTGGGVTTLSNVNTSMTGGVTLTQGILRGETNANALGTGVGTLALNGGELQLAHTANVAFNRNTTVGGNVTITSDRTGTSGAGVTHTLGTLDIGANTLSIARGALVDSGTAGITFGVTTLSGNATFNAGTGTLLTIANTLALGSNQLTVTGAGNVSQTSGGSITGNTGGSIVLDSNFTGTFTAARTGNNFSGGLTIKSGTYDGTAGDANIYGTGTITLGDSTANANTATLRRSNNSGTATNAITITNSNQTKIIEGNASGTNTALLRPATITVNGDVTLRSTGTSLLSINDNNSGTWSGSGTITVDGGSVGIGGGTPTSFTSNYRVTSGTLRVLGSNPFSSVQSVSVGSSGTLDVQQAVTIAGLNDISGSGGAVVNTTGTDRILTLGGNGSYSFSGDIAPATASRIALTKNGTGTQALGGNNTYAGDTIVSGSGTLLINGTHIQNTTTTDYAVSGTDTTLGGTGRIAIGGNISIATGSILAPGASIGTLTLDGIHRTGAVLSMASGSKFAFELAGNGGTPDQLSFWNYVSGDLGLNNNAIDLTLSGPVVAGTYTVNIFNFFSDGGSTATTHAFSSGLTIGTLGTGITSASIVWAGTGNNNENIALTYTVIPEPSSFALLAGGLAALAFLRRRMPPSI